MANNQPKSPSHRRVFPSRRRLFFWIVVAIFLLGIRAAFFKNADAEECLAGITPQIDLLLKGLAPCFAKRAKPGGD